MSIESLFAQPTALPVIPKVVAQLIRSFEREDVAVETIDESLRLLGFVMTRNLVLGAGVGHAFKAVPGVDLPQFWRHSLHTACAARWLARVAGQDGELAFTVGLVHGLGHLVMHAVMGRDLTALDRRVPLFAADRAAAERELLGYHHGEVGAELALRWRFPSSIAEALGAIAQPCGSDVPPVALLVHVAAWRARAEALRLRDADVATDCPQAVARRLGLHVQWLAAERTAAVQPMAGGATASMPALKALCGGLDGMV